MTEPTPLSPLELHGSPPPGRRPRVAYVHAPFCARRCFYCDFAVHVRKEASPEPWLRALTLEWTALEEEGTFRPEAPLETLYVGGGTPSLLGPGAMEGLAGILGPALLGSPELEWTAEANPEGFTPELAAAWIEAGVNRVSLGVQSFQEAPLRWMGRLHGPRGAEEAVRTARDAGFSNLSVDLIFGLPERLERSWEADLDRVLGLEVPHVSLYGLSVEEETPLGRAVRRGRERVAGAEAYERAYLMAADRLREAGYVHYEVSSFALPGRESRHNARYWDGSSYLGMGNSAHSYRHPIRRWNLRDWGAYSSAVEEGELPLAEQEELSPATARLERIWLGLRTRSGLHRASLSPAAKAVTDRWIAEGRAREAGEAVRLTPRGWLVTDRLVLELERAWGEPPEEGPTGPARPGVETVTGRKPGS